MRSQKLLVALAATIALICLGSCTSKDSAEKPAATADSGPAYTPTGNEGSISGTIAFTAPPPALRKIQMDSDPNCAKRAGDATSEEVVVTDGHLANVIVFIKSGLPKNTFPTPADEVTLDQVGCRYVPHVLALQTNQTLKVLNSDATSHNVHPVPKNNREWNETQYPSAPPIVKKFANEEVLIPIKCNQHSWMKAYVAVLNHPFHSVSGKDGSFVIKGVPPGTYEVEAFHEKVQSKSVQVTVTAKAETKANFSFDASTASNQGTLKIQPALVVP